MDILTQKRITDNGEGKGYFKNSVNYVYKEKTEPGEALIQTKGYNVSDHSPEMTYEQMYAVKDYYGKTGDNPVMNFVISFDKNSVNDAETACEYVEKVAGLFTDDYQVITAVHEENQGNSMYHGHIVVNTVNMNNGKLYHSGKKELTELAMDIKDITGNYCKPDMKK